MPNNNTFLHDFYKHLILAIGDLQSIAYLSNFMFLKIFDGWLTQKGMLPNEIDHEVPLSERVVRYCDWVRSGQQDSLVFVSTQNVALVQYRLKTENFLTFRFRKVHSEKCKETNFFLKRLVSGVIKWKRSDA